MTKSAKTAAKRRADSGKRPSGAKASPTVFRSKSGRFIIASPVKSANTITAWSDAFRRD